MSANLLVDAANTCDYFVSVPNTTSGAAEVVGGIVDLLGANTYCNVWAAGVGSGFARYLIQTSETTTSGSFTDPTSGLAQMPVNIVSGGVFIVNSGLWSSGWSSPAPPVDNAPMFCSGGIQFGAFQRPHRYARLILVSGVAHTNLNTTAGFMSNKKVTGFGGGFTFSPLSGTVNV